MSNEDDEVVIDFRSNEVAQEMTTRDAKSMEKFCYQVNQFTKPYLEYGQGKVDQLHNYFKDNHKDSAIVAATGAIVGALGYAGVEVAKAAAGLVTASNHLNVAHPHVIGAVHKVMPIGKHIPVKAMAHHGAHLAHHAGKAAIHHGAHLAHKAGHAVIHHGAHVLPHHLPGGAAAAAHSAGIGATLMPLFTATVISASVALVCYELYKRNEKDMAKYVEKDMHKSPALQEYIEQVGKDSGAVDRLKKGEYLGFKDIGNMVELTGRYLAGKSQETWVHVNDQAQTMIASVSQYMNATKAQTR